MTPHEMHGRAVSLIRSATNALDNAEAAPTVHLAIDAITLAANVIGTQFQSLPTTTVVPEPASDKIEDDSPAPVRRKRKRGVIVARDLRVSRRLYAEPELAPALIVSTRYLRWFEKQGSRFSTSGVRPVDVFWAVVKLQFADGVATIAEINRTTGCRTDVTTKVLRFLDDIGLVKRHTSGRSVYFTLTPGANFRLEELRAG